jgi:hypothetical protein
VIVTFIDTRPISSMLAGQPSNRPRAVTRGELQRGTVNRADFNGRQMMTAEWVRTVSTCVAALFVSTLLVTAATSMPMMF